MIFIKGGSKMNDEELAKIKEEYETSIIRHKIARKKKEQAAINIEAANVAYNSAKEALETALQNVNNSRIKYENAVYEFYEEYNE
jgi:ATP:corrinoid adenosyltransferase